MAQRWNEQLAGAGVPDQRRFESWIASGQLTKNDLQLSRRWLLVGGIIAVINGIIAILLPVVASVATTILIGWVLLVAGIAIGMSAISHRSWLRALDALLSLIAGFYVLVFPLSGTVTLTFVLAVWFFASGVLSVTHALQWRGTPESWMTGVGGALSIILGFLIAASLPSSAAWAVGLLVGINLIVWGVRALVGARLLKNLIED
jgi:uncharacterized membrane protein HdeD (DUF308 family)